VKQKTPSGDFFGNLEQFQINNTLKETLLPLQKSEISVHIALFHN
jgi:hypothetical protein